MAGWGRFQESGAGRQAGLGRSRGGAFQIHTELGFLGCLSLLLLFQLPLPLMELMENEVLTILSKALNSEHPHPSFHKTSWWLWQGLGLQEWNFRMCMSCQIALALTNIPRDPPKLKVERQGTGRLNGFLRLSSGMTDSLCGVLLYSEGREL